MDKRAIYPLQKPGVQLQNPSHQPDRFPDERPSPVANIFRDPQNRFKSPVHGAAHPSFVGAHLNKDPWLAVGERSGTGCLGPT